MNQSHTSTWQSVNPSIWRTLLPAILGAAEAADGETINAHRLASADPAVVKLASLCVSELARLVQDGGYEHFISGSIQGGAVAEVTPAQWLETQLGMLRAEIDLLKRERQTAKDRWREAAERARPLVLAVGELSMKAEATRNAAMRHLDGLARSAREPVSNMARYETLLAAGLTRDQMNTVMPGIQEAATELPAQREEQVTKFQAMAQEAERVLVAVKAWADDPLHDVAHLRGIGLDHLVEAQSAHGLVAA